jgi:hypothetical protein
MIAAALVAGALMLLQASAPSQDASSSMRLPVSIERIRQALQQRPALTVHPVIPDFRVDVHEHQRFEQLLPQWDFRSGPVPPGGLYAYEQLQRSGVPIAQPLVLVDLIAIGRALAGARAAHAAGAAREDVQRAIAEYCAAQPDGGAAIAICAK